MCLLILLVIITVQANSRKYDIEEEAKKLYGEDLSNVLKRFRRTPDYYRLLKEEMTVMLGNSEDMHSTVMHYEIQKAKKRIIEMVGEPAPLEEDECLRYGKLLRCKKTQRADAARNLTSIEQLDHYGMLSRNLSLSEINMYKDLGFEYAGEVIHTIIKAMGNEDFALKSTKLPFGGMDEEKPVTKEHVHNHVIYSTKVTIGEDTLADDTYKLRFNKLSTRLQKKQKS